MVQTWNNIFKLGFYDKYDLFDLINDILIIFVLTIWKTWCGVVKVLYKNNQQELLHVSFGSQCGQI